MSVGGAGGPVGAAEDRAAHRCARRDAQRVSEDRGWCLVDEFAPGGQLACPGGDAELVKDADEAAVAAVFGRELPGKPPWRGGGGRGGHVAAVAQVLPQQGRNGLGHVETVRVRRKIELPEERRMLTQPLPKRPHRMQPAGPANSEVANNRASPVPTFPGTG